MITVYLRFATLAELRTFARLLKEHLDDADLDRDTLSADGWFRGIYVNVDFCFGNGRVRDTETGLVQRTGFHVNLRWCGTEDQLPAAIAPYRVFPVHPAVVFG